MGVLGAGQAQALVVTVSNQQWDVTTFTATRQQLFTQSLQSLAPTWFSPTSPWGFANTPRATAFSNAVNSVLGVSFNSDNNNTFEQGLPLTGGPWFVTGGFGGNAFNDNDGTDEEFNYQYYRLCYWAASSTACPSQTFTNIPFPNSNILVGSVSITDGGILAGKPNLTDNFAFTFAAAKLLGNSVPVPGPLPLLGAAAAFGFSRKLRKRINISKAVDASTTAA
jgi:hypothetical protein